MADQQQPQQRRRSFDEVLHDALVQWTKKFERALEEQRELLGRDAQQRSDDIERAALEHLGNIERAAAEKTAELQQIAVDYREANERAIAERSTALEDATRQQVDASKAEAATAFEEFADKRLDELEDNLRAKLEGLRRELIDETHRVRAATSEQLTETRSLVTSETRRLEEHAAATENEMRRVAAEETAAFDELARGRVAELQDALRNQTELLGEFTRMHGSTSDQLDEVRAFTKETMDRLSKLNDSVARQIRVNDESAAAAADKLKHTSATELNSIQQRAIALDELARKHIADVERQVGKLLEAETATAEGLREFERQMEGRRAEIETLADERIAALGQHVRQAEAAAVRRITELGERAEDNAEALDARLARATDERTKEFDAFAENITQGLVEMVAAVRVTLDQVSARVEALEASPGAALPEGRAIQARALDGGAARRPIRDARSTPDLRGDR